MTNAAPSQLIFGWRGVVRFSGSNDARQIACFFALALVTPLGRGH